MTEDNSRSAISDRREQVKSFERPQRLNEGLSIKEAVGEVRETEDLFKLYLREWQIVYTASTQEEVQAFFDKKYEGRVHAEDVSIEPCSEKSPEKYGHWLKLRLPNVRGEFKTKAGAEAYAAEHYSASDCDIVARNSRDDYALREYGTKKLLAKRS